MALHNLPSFCLFIGRDGMDCTNCWKQEIVKSLKQGAFRL